MGKAKNKIRLIIGFAYLNLKNKEFKQNVIYINQWVKNEKKTINRKGDNAK